ncbi:MAG: Leu/Phe/Val dehydrogenase [Thiohalomonadales bacterium]
MDLLEVAGSMQFGDIHIKTDAKTGLKAIIAIHNTHLGPALGGCRCVSYPTHDAAVLDAMRLAQGMSYKAAIATIPHGGGKSVLIKPDMPYDREAMFESFGEFVETLAGRYITAVDSGSSVKDMDVIARKTKHVVSISKHAGGKGDPSPYTSLGVLRGIQAAVQFKLGKDSLAGIHVAIQGAGNVGYHLSKLLVDLGAKISVCDSKPEAERRFATDFNARIVPNEAIFDLDCDVFAPCALGAILNDKTAHSLKASIVAGGANNQLANPRVAQLLHKRGILYATDYVINAGGLIHVSIDNAEEIKLKVDHIYDALQEIFQRSQEDDLPTSVVADDIAQEIINAAKPFH